VNAVTACEELSLMQGDDGVASKGPYFCKAQIPPGQESLD